MRVQAEKSMFIAVDYQEKLLPAIEDRDRMMKKSVFLINGLKALGIPMIMTTQYSRGLGKNVAEIADLIGRDREYDKVTFSIYQNEETAGLIDGSGCRFVILAGIEAHICVLQTIVDLAEAGYVPVLVTDCIGARHREDLETALIRAGHEGAILTTAEALLYELAGTSKHPGFKAVSNLVKAYGKDET